MDTLLDFMNTPLFELGGTMLTPKVLAILVVAVAALVVITRLLERWGAAMLTRRNAEPGAAKALFQILRYVALAVGMIAILQSVGIDLSAFVVVIGTFGIGVGLALQPLLSNFVGGLVLLIERPLKVGDRIQIGETAGQVIHIGARATNVLTNDNINVIVPNSQLTSTQIINWSHRERSVRVHVPIGVSYKADPRHVEKVLLDVAKNHPGVLAEPAPTVLLDRFDDSAVVFILNVWTEAYLERPRQLRSDINFAISEALRANGIEIPFPQRDVHVVSGAPAALASSSVSSRPSGAST